VPDARTGRAGGGELRHLLQAHKLTKALLIGGVSFKEQDKLIDRGVDVLIATPGRLLDHFERGKLMLTGVQIMVVDEADRMLDMGFIPDIERIFKLTPFTRQTLFFSATMAPEIERITNTFLSQPRADRSGAPGHHRRDHRTRRWSSSASPATGRGRPRKSATCCAR
jgi:superfamily II DNA/RNA helicase